MMKHFPLIWSNLFRKKVRTILTLLSITTAFLLFGLLQAINQGFSNGASSAKADRMITNSKYSIMDTMPVSYLKQIEAVPGVEKAAFATWFGGRYRDKPAPFAIFPVVPDAYLALVPELQISAQALAPGTAPAAAWWWVKHWPSACSGKRATSWQSTRTSGQRPMAR